MPPKSKGQKGLGRGISALMGDFDLDEAVGGSSGVVAGDQTVPIEQIAPNPDQPRRRFDKEPLEELAASIRQRGVLQPLIVRPSARDTAHFEIVAGERRWRAAQIAQIHEVPVIVKDLTDSEVLEIAIIENIQREDLNPIEEARGYRQLIETYSHTQEALSGLLGKSRSQIANAMRLLTLPLDVTDLVEAGVLSAGHARALVTAENASALAKEVVAKGLSVRATEQLAKQVKTSSRTMKSPPSAEKDSDTKAIEGDLSANLRMKVSINHKDAGGRGEMVITYGSLDQLDTLCQMLSATPPDDSI